MKSFDFWCNDYNHIYVRCMVNYSTRNAFSGDSKEHSIKCFCYSNFLIFFVSHNIIAMIRRTIVKTGIDFNSRLTIFRALASVFVCVSFVFWHSNFANNRMKRVLFAAISHRMWEICMLAMLLVCFIWHNELSFSLAQCTPILSKFLWIWNFITRNSSIPAILSIKRSKFWTKSIFWTKSPFLQTNVGNYCSSCQKLITCSALNCVFQTYFVTFVENL